MGSGAANSEAVGLGLMLGLGSLASSVSVLGLAEAELLAVGLKLAFVEQPTRAKSVMKNTNNCFIPTIQIGRMTAESV